MISEGQQVERKPFLRLPVGAALFVVGLLIGLASTASGAYWVRDSDNPEWREKPVCPRYHEPQFWGVMLSGTQWVPVYQCLAVGEEPGSESEPMDANVVEKTVSPV